MQQDRHWHFYKILCGMIQGLNAKEASCNKILKPEQRPWAEKALKLLLAKVEKEKQVAAYLSQLLVLEDRMHDKKQEITEKLTHVINHPLFSHKLQKHDKDPVLYSCKNLKNRLDSVPAPAKKLVNTLYAYEKQIACLDNMLRDEREVVQPFVKTLDAEVEALNQRLQGLNLSH